MKKRIVLAEDDQKLAQLIKDYLIQNDFEVVHEVRGEKIAGLVQKHKPDIVILDIMLPGKDGFDICKSLREFYRGPILMFTARESDIDQVVGLELGADDYVVKPIEPRVLLARVNALLRRAQSDSSSKQSSAATMTFGALELKPKSRTASIGSKEVDLTSHEFDLLWYLAERSGQIVTREVIHRDIIGREYDGLDRTVDMRVSHLRKKLGDDNQKPERIKTVWGKGYLFVPEGWD
ncbi:MULTISPECIES: winged helix-turn-helix domain-containing protein [Gammaproteobacteria]|uniref:winged helix-turn-helix domain-containing protein n=1 Tax=Gammaproteobacteria TaxID=1236 RepID=UPI000DCFF419|nr:MULTISPECIES: winged helix-turn-helix domain-containing protein [Gammaproteobacteria]RTE86740.1 response regulator [Aliidiomarina sp. B3213]TCZ90706.1 response regulator [Lysobacter sp. N42]